MNDKPCTYWNRTRKQSALAEKVQKLIPSDGSCPANKPDLERLRKAANAYYDALNNGRYTNFRNIFGVGGKAYVEAYNRIFMKAYRSPEMLAVLEKVESKLDTLVADAAVENIEDLITF